MKSISKRLITLLFILLLGTSISACTIAKAQENNDELIRINYDLDPSNQIDSEGNLQVPFDIIHKSAFENNEIPYDSSSILLKLPNSKNPLSRNLKNLGIDTLTVIIPGEKVSWFKATLKQNVYAKDVMKKVRDLSEVLIAEYNFTYQTAEVSIEDNPLSENQWYLNRYGIQEAWAYLEGLGHHPGGGQNIIVAVIDTGVDITHPDLINNIWKNPIEISNGEDDDNNGYVDDFYGYNFVSDSIYENNNVMDDHGHGTHVAGIIAAGNNNIGTVGVAFNVKIMPIKAGSSSGQFAQADIAQAVLYAYENGADVINMSFGGQAISIAVQEALMTAYTRSVLVASAGNSGRPNEMADSYYAEVNYPAALPYVIGVMSVDATNKESAFTNWDVKFNNNIEYEVYMTGEQITSTLPDNRYATWSGTSMATPIISAMAAILRTVYRDRDQFPNKFIMGQIISSSSTFAQCLNPDRHTLDFKPHTTGLVANIYEALTVMPSPEVKLYDYFTFDDETISQLNNSDGAIDHNEVIEIGFILQNRWGMSKNTTLKFDTINEFGMSSPYLEFLTNDLNYESVGTYSTKDYLIRDGQRITGSSLPLRVKIAQNTPNDTLIRINVTIEYENALDEDDETIYKSYETIELIIRNGVVLPNIITQNTTLTKNNFYLLPNAMSIAEGVTVVIEAGTKIQFWSSDPSDPYATKGISYIKVDGTLLVEGTAENPVEMFPSELFYNYIVRIYESETGRVHMKYANITNADLNISYASNCKFEYALYGGLYFRFLNDGILSDYSYPVNMKITLAEYNVFANMGGLKDNSSRGYLRGRYENNLFYNVTLHLSNEASYQNNVFLGNNNLDYGGKLASTVYMTIINNIDKNRTQMIYDELTNTVYAIYSFINFPSQSEGLSLIYSQLAEYMNGHLIQIETEEEYLLLANAFQDPYLLGLRYDPRIGQATWLDGTPLADFIQFSHYPQLMKNTSLGMIWGGGFGFMSSYRVGIEIPLEDGQSVPTIGDLNTFWDDFHASGENSYFINNAILNKLSDPDSSKWLLFMGYDTSSTTPSQYVQSIGLANNYWGNTDYRFIEDQILDFKDYQTLQLINPYPILEEAPELAFPYVTEVSVYNGLGELVETVANEPIRVVVKFSKDMDTTIPLQVRFGSVLPFADYELEGEYIDNRTWEGYYLLNTFIENGMQYFSIANGTSLDDSWFSLYADRGRFTFKIDTTLAQAMIMQGSPTTEGILLEWYQDDFDTLAGYHIYRSDYEDGHFVRLNQNIIPSDVKEFFDKTVLPGKMYYYNFTVIKTDLTESEPSGKIQIQSLDTMAPNIYHTPVQTAFTNKNLMVAAVITDNLAIHQARLYYRVVGQTTYLSTTMAKSNDRFTGIINAEYLQLEGLEYYIETSDGINITTNGSSEFPHLVMVQVSVNDSSLGDVNGDGMITIVDALMMLMAINDRLNLTQPEFLRADIDQNGILETWEVLRILHYINGKVQTIKPVA